MAALSRDLPRDLLVAVLRDCADLCREPFNPVLRRPIAYEAFSDVLRHVAYMYEKDVTWLPKNPPVGLFRSLDILARRVFSAAIPRRVVALLRALVWLDVEDIARHGKRQCPRIVKALADIEKEES